MWTDGSPYLYDNNRLPYREDILMLDTSIETDYQYSPNLDKHYMTTFKYKLKYIKQIIEKGTDSNHTDICTAIFLTYFTIPNWFSIGCNDILPNMHFLCEIPHSEVLNVSYVRGNIICPKRTTFIDELCWSVQKYTKGKVNVLLLSNALQLMLSSWSLGDDLRTNVSVSGISNTCLNTNGLSRQRIRKWSPIKQCDRIEYVLLGHNYLTYTFICQGTYHLSLMHHISYIIESRAVVIDNTNSILYVLK